MPVYMYGCEDCRTRFEKRLSYDEFDLVTVTCPSCGGTRVARRITRVHTVQSDQFRVFREADVNGDDRALGKMMQEVKAASGAPTAPEYDEVAERLSDGESMASIDRSFE